MKKHHKNRKKATARMAQLHIHVPKLEHIYLTPRKKRKGVILRDGCKLYTASSAEELKKYLKEKGLI